MLLQAQDYTHFAENIAKVFIPAVTVAIAIYNWRAARFRSKIKDDLDILKRYTEELAENGAAETARSKEICRHLRARIERRMYKAYVQRRTDKSDILSGVVLVFLAFVTWIPVFANWDFRLRLGVSIAAASFGLALFYAGIKDREEPRKIKNLPAT